MLSLNGFHDVFLGHLDSYTNNSMNLDRRYRFHGVTCSGSMENNLKFLNLFFCKSLSMHHSVDIAFPDVFEITIIFPENKRHLTSERYVDQIRRSRFPRYKAEMATTSYTKSSPMSRKIGGIEPANISRFLLCLILKVI